MTTPKSQRKSLWSDLSLDSFGFTRVAVVLTGSSVSQVMPYWIEWAQESAPNTEFRIIARESCYRFITRHALEARTRLRVSDDSWGDAIIAEHIELAEWADLIVAYPATLDYCSRIAHGVTDSPSVLAALSTEALVAIAPALPPRSVGNPLVDKVLDKLRQPSNFLVVDPVPGPSESSDISLAWVPPPFPAVLRAAEQKRLSNGQATATPEQPDLTRTAPEQQSHQTRTSA